MFEKVASVSDVPPGEGRQFDVQGRAVAVFNIAGAFHAIGGICPHMGGPLAKGYLEGTVVSCPWHGWPFDLTDGCRPGDATCAVPKYAAKVEDEDLLVDVADPVQT